MQVIGSPAARGFLSDQKSFSDGSVSPVPRAKPTRGGQAGGEINKSRWTTDNRQRTAALSPAKSFSDFEFRIYNLDRASLFTP
jgi:hypothetical protein